MIPKVDRAFYQLGTVQRLLYLTGMPRPFCTSPDVKPGFLNTKLTSKVLTSVEQATKFQELQKCLSPDSLTIISSFPTDHDAIGTASQLVRSYVHSGTRNIEYVHPTEYFPREHEKLKDLYVITGVHEKDIEILHHVRRWVRSSLGVPRILVVTTNEPYRWCCESLGCVPDFLFHTRIQGTSIG